MYKRDLVHLDSSRCLVPTGCDPWVHIWVPRMQGVCVCVRIHTHTPTYIPTCVKKIDNTQTTPLSLLLSKITSHTNQQVLYTGSTSSPSSPNANKQTARPDFCKTLGSTTCRRFTCRSSLVHECGVPLLVVLPLLRLRWVLFNNPSCLVHRLHIVILHPLLRIWPLECRGNKNIFFCREFVFGITVKRKEGSRRGGGPWEQGTGTEKYGNSTCFSMFPKHVHGTLRENPSLLFLFIRYQNCTCEKQRDSFHQKWRILNPNILHPNISENEQ